MRSQSSKRVMMSTSTGRGISSLLNPKKRRKKLVIKSFARKPKPPSDFETETWKRLEEGIRAIFQKKATSQCYQELLNGVENLCIHKKSKSLRSKLEAECDGMIAQEVNVLRGSLDTPDMGAFLRSIHDVWQDHCQHVSLVRNIFMYFDRTCLAQDTNSTLRSVRDIGLFFLRAHLDRHPGIAARADQGVLELIAKERMGQVVDRECARSILDMYWDVDLYCSNFESKMLSSTTTFYEIEAERLVRDLEVPDLLRHIERRLNEEQERVAHYLNPCSEKRLVSIVEEQFLEKRACTIIEKGFSALMEKKAVNDLKSMYRLLRRIDGLPELCNAFKSYVQQVGSRVICDKKKDREMIEILLRLKSKIDEIVSKSFSNDRIFRIARDDAFAVAMNARSNRPPELLAKFVHQQLRTSNKASPSEILSLLNRALVLFRFLNGKDVFEAFYKDDLARRLLFKQSSSLSLERHMIRELKITCGSVYTNKLEGMFKDMDVSKEITEAFRAKEARKRRPRSDEAPSSSCTAFVHMLTTGFWPSYEGMQIQLPSAIMVQTKAFGDFYADKYSGRRLTWQHGLSTCVLRAQFAGAKRGTSAAVHEIHASVAQTSVLMLFNEKNELSLDEIGAAVKLDRNVLVRVLKSLCNPKLRILRVRKAVAEAAASSSSSQTTTTSNRFSFNETFSHKFFRLKINALHTKEKKQQKQKATTERVARERQYLVDAVVVRTMKTRKTLKYGELIAECVRHLKIPVEPSTIKKRIESLIDRDYIERSKEDPSTYHYVS